MGETTESIIDSSQKRVFLDRTNFTEQNKFKGEPPKTTAFCVFDNLIVFRFASIKKLQK